MFLHSQMATEDHVFYHIMQLHLFVNVCLEAIHNEELSDLDGPAVQTVEQRDGVA